MSINQFKYKITYNNNSLHLKINSLNIKVNNNNVYINNNLTTYTNNKIICNSQLKQAQYNKLLELFKKGLYNYLIYLNNQKIKKAENVKIRNNTGSFLYIGDLKTSYKRITEIYFSCDEIQI